MSIVIALKHDGYVSFASDSRSSGNSFFVTSEEGPSGKLFRLKNGVVFGSVGTVTSKSLLAPIMSEMKLSDKNTLTSARLQKEFVPKAIDILKKTGNLGSDFPNGDLGVRLLIGYRDKLFLTDQSTLSTYEVKKGAAIGDISSIASLLLKKYSGGDVHSFLVDALERTAKFDNCVASPWRFVDTDKPGNGAEP